MGVRALLLMAAIVVPCVVLPSFSIGYLIAHPFWILVLLIATGIPLFHLRDRLRTGPFVLAADERAVYFQLVGSLQIVSVDWVHCKSVSRGTLGGSRQGVGVRFVFNDYEGASWRRPAHGQLLANEQPTTAVSVGPGLDALIVELEKLRRKATANGFEDEARVRIDPVYFASAMIAFILAGVVAWQGVGREVVEARAMRNWTVVPADIVELKLDVGQVIPAKGPGGPPDTTHDTYEVLTRYVYVVDGQRYTASRTAVEHGWSYNAELARKRFVILSRAKHQGWPVEVRVDPVDPRRSVIFPELDMVRIKRTLTPFSLPFAAIGCLFLLYGLVQGRYSPRTITGSAMWRRE